MEEPIRSYITICTWFTRSKMGNVLAASPTNPSSSSNVTSIPPPPPLTAPPPVEEKSPSAEKKATENNPGTYEDLHKACKGRFHVNLVPPTCNRLLGFSLCESRDSRRLPCFMAKRNACNTSDMKNVLIFLKLCCHFCEFSTYSCSM